MKEIEYLKREELEVGAKYECLARNFEIGIWDGEAFNYTRLKFKDRFPDKEYHWDDGPPFGTVKPIRKVE